jgi:hypothetical protein
MTVWGAPWIGLPSMIRPRCLQGSPSFVKANAAKAKDKKVRKKRKPEENGARRREAPMQIVEHRIEQCPECGLRLGGISLGRQRQVIEVPAPPAVEVIEHQVYKGWCSGCQKWREAPLDLGSGSHEHDGPFTVVAMEKEGQTRRVHEQRCARKKAFCATSASQTLSQGIVPAFQHAPFPRFPFLQLSAAPLG